jgi:hypothetical protein
VKTQIFVMPARIAGIQVRMDASGDIRVNLDSSTPCWNDADEGSAQTDRGPSGRIFKGAFVVSLLLFMFVVLQFFFLKPLRQPAFEQ